MELHSLRDIRKQFDDVDKSILILLGIRSQLSKEIARIKKHKNLDIVQMQAWEKQMKNRYKENKKLNISPEFLDKIFTVIHKESIRIQKQEVKKAL